MYLFLFLTEMLYLEYSEPQDGNSPFKANDIRGLIAFYDTVNKVNELYDLLDLWKSKQEIDDCLNTVFSDTFCEGKVRVFDDSYNLFEVTINRNSIKTPNKVLLFLLMKRLILFKKKGMQDPDLQNYMRIIRNFVVKVRQRKNESYTPDFRFCRHGIPYVSFGLDDILESENIYDFVSKYIPAEDDNRINSESLKYEKDKAIFIIDNPEYEEYIHSLEDMVEFKTFIHNIMPFVKVHHIPDLSAYIKTLFNCKYFNKLVRALLSVDDYGIRLGSSFYGDRYFYGNRSKDWYNILSSTDQQNYPQIISKFMEQVYEIGESDTEKCLDKIINNNINKIDQNCWRFYFLKYPRLLDNYSGFVDAQNLVIMLEKVSGGKAIIPHRLNGKSLMGYHACALYLEASMELCGNLKFVERVKDSESLGALTFQSGTTVRISPKDLVEVYYNTEEDITCKVVTRVDELWKEAEVDDMDFVERLVLMSRFVLQSEEEILQST